MASPWLLVLFLPWQFTTEPYVSNYVTSDLNQYLRTDRFKSPNNVNTNTNRINIPNINISLALLPSDLGGPGGSGQPNNGGSPSPPGLSGPSNGANPSTDSGSAQPNNGGSPSPPGSSGSSNGAKPPKGSGTGLPNNYPNPPNIGSNVKPNPGLPNGIGPNLIEGLGSFPKLNPNLPNIGNNFGPNLALPQNVIDPITGLPIAGDGQIANPSRPDIADVDIASLDALNLTALQTLPKLNISRPSLPSIMGPNIGNKFRPIPPGSSVNPNLNLANGIDPITGLPVIGGVQFPSPNVASPPGVDISPPEELHLLPPPTPPKLVIPRPSLPALVLPKLFPKT